MKQLYDRYDRLHNYIRVSITDRCPLRCVYCMPKEGLPFFPSDRVLSQDEIVQMVQNFAEMGVSKVRFTGGEPLLRTDVAEIISRVHDIPEIDDISVTTNGLYLARKAEALKEAGLDRLNISLDTFKADRYKKITRGGNIKQVLKGIEVASKLGFMIKLNVVVIKNQNDDEILDFLNYTRDHNVNIRFIEFMPIGNSKEVWKKEYVGLKSVFDVCQENGIEYQPITLRGNGPSENFKIKDATGSFGLIHPISNKFCETCNRLRITPDGYVKACLYWGEEINIRKAIPDKPEFQRLIQQALDNKPLNHEMALTDADKVINKAPTWRHMSQIGG
ncbi:MULTISPECIES: GTP 3',8-cyclase MoaA [Loigolactobacillus]|uniref:GTP 3',8-cyclase n=1 Tax=Loigolactobacillus backii TaxID=375175 RepID=A0A192H1A9_9LACO|nr:MULTISPECIES: GTP 3',8-cyclase MoaA [Loigolactobacillus]ANK62068.1 cyclic pyranopterin phosphate synthase MoaA [Loigolactobacillus backii]ANK68738.1 cyclic pyranopterin phosphate synthase MoaA [Loigolactobacillus backii]MDA5386742.1 GTP 3',8-cyclase MoaA [Loigolactobacillus backii]MDA5389267.1 GTP 3',8-cyclase MoaA [Loigolactobacillus backii]